MAKDELTIPDLLLRTAATLDAPFSAEQLVVAAWKLHPIRFGLKNGYEKQYPDSNRVLSCLMGAKGLVKRGWFVKVGEKMYRLSSTGRFILDGHIPEKFKTKKMVIRLQAEEEKFLAHLYLFDEPTTFTEASRWWMLGPDPLVDLSHFSQSLSRIATILKTQDALLPDGRHVEWDDINKLQLLHESLLARHAKQLRKLSGDPDLAKHLKVLDDVSLSPGAHR